MSKPHAVIAHHEPNTGTPTSYTIGFGLSVALTLVAYLLVVNQKLSHRWLLATIVTLALVQFLVQVVFFLHLGTETKPRWKLLVFLSMVSIVAILVIGSIWIMDNLNYHMMSLHEEQIYMHDHEGL
jgi:cytochrome o ubiquinol oxidase operon protein cyoD